jgi:UDP-glucose 4-epimerase
MIYDQNILITGGCGFIGSHIAESLVKENDVILIDNLSSGKLENIKNFKGGVRFIRADVRDKISISDAFERVDIVFHEAANVFIETSIKKPDYDLEVNGLGTINVLELCRQKDIEKVIYASSSAVYGNPKYSPIDENHPISPHSPYAISKLTGEYLCRLYYELYGLKTVCLRYFNVYGSRQDASNPYSGVVAIFVDNALKEKPLSIYGDGEQRRDFIHVRDVVRANLLAATSKNAAGEVFNIGTGKSFSLNELVNLIKNLGYNAKVEYRPTRIGDVRKSLANVNKAMEYLDFKTEISFLEGLEEYFAWRKKEGGRVNIDISNIASF